jgi:hypothetical protein
MFTDTKEWSGRPFARVALAALAALVLLPAGAAGAVEVEAGDILVADANAFGFPGGVIHLDPATGAQTTVSSGGSFNFPVDVAVEADRDILITDAQAFGGAGA